MAPVVRLMETTSAKLGRETTIDAPSGVEYMSSTNWSWPSPTLFRIVMKAIHRIGSALISAIRASLSGMTLTRPTFAKSPEDLMTSAVPSQLLPTNITSRRSAAALAGVAVTAAEAVRASAAATAPRWRFPRRRGVRVSDMVGSSCLLRA